MKNIYYSRLQKELESYPYRSDYIHSVSGIDIKVPMIYKDATSIMYFFVVETSKVMVFIKDKRIRPISIFRNRTLLAINVFKYRESEVGSFNEFTFSVPVMVGSKMSISFFPLILDQIFSKFGFYVIQLGASNDVGRKHIEDIWGYPTYQNNLNISLDIENGYLDSIIQDHDKNILTMSESLPKIFDLKFQKKRFNSYFIYGNELRQVELNTLLFRKMWLGKRDFKIEIGDHPVSEILKKINIRTKIATVFYPYAIEIAGRAKII